MVHITDVLAVAMMLGITAQVKEAGTAWDKGEKKSKDPGQTDTTQLQGRDGVGQGGAFPRLQAVPPGPRERMLGQTRPPPPDTRSFWKLPLPVLQAQGLLSAWVICSLGGVSGSVPPLRAGRQEGGVGLSAASPHREARWESSCRGLPSALTKS